MKAVKLLTYQFANNHAITVPTRDFSLPAGQYANLLIFIEGLTGASNNTVQDVEKVLNVKLTRNGTQILNLPYSTLAIYNAYMFGRAYYYNPNTQNKPALFGINIPFYIAGLPNIYDVAKDELVLTIDTSGVYTSTSTDGKGIKEASIIVYGVFEPFVAETYRIEMFREIVQKVAGGQSQTDLVGGNIAYLHLRHVKAGAFEASGSTGNDIKNIYLTVDGEVVYNDAPRYLTRISDAFINGYLRGFQDFDADETFTINDLVTSNYINSRAFALNLSNGTYVGAFNKAVRLEVNYGSTLVTGSNNLEVFKVHVYDSPIMNISLQRLKTAVQRKQQMYGITAGLGGGRANVINMISDTYYPVQS